jgi:hypothetical protein
MVPLPLPADFLRRRARRLAELAAVLRKKTDNPEAQRIAANLQTCARLRELQVEKKVLDSVDSPTAP